MLRLIGFFCLALGISGCVSATSIGSSEIAVYQAHDHNKLATLDGATNYADHLAELYIHYSDQAALGQDLTSVGLIGAAATAAGGLIYEAELDLVRGAGLTAGIISTLANYLNTGEPNKALLNGAEQLVCISKSGQAAKDLMSEKLYHEIAVNLLHSAIRQVRINLRKTISRERIDYATLVNQLTEFGRVDPQKYRINKNPGLDKIFKQLKDDIKECLLISI